MVGKRLIYLLMIGFAYLVFNSSCANQGMPSGGPIDSIAPVLLKSEPRLNAINVNPSEIKLTFDEYVVSDGVIDKLIISPPLKTRPLIRMKGKTLILHLNDTLKPATTYSFDFQDGIADNNEKNAIPEFKTAFSTGNHIDTLQISGIVRNAFNLEPLSGISVYLYQDLSDSAIFKGKPNYMGKTNKKGMFCIGSLPKGKYRIFAFKNEAANGHFNLDKDSVAFLPSVLTPDAHYVAKPQKIIKGKDTLLVKGTTEFLPEPLWLSAFQHPSRKQHLETSKRENRSHCIFIFKSPTDQSLSFEPVGASVQGKWNISKISPGKDTIDLWITHPNLLKQDSLKMKVSYNTLNASGKLHLASDTIVLFYKEPVVTEKAKKKKKKQQEEKPSVPTFYVECNAGKDHDLNRDIAIRITEPYLKLDTTKIHLAIKKDTLFLPIKKRIIPDSSNILRIFIQRDWQERMDYKLTVDSAAIQTLSGAVNMASVHNFNTQAESFYGKIIVKVSGTKIPCILQIVKNDDKEELVSQRFATSGQTVTFDYLKPDKYKIKLILDSNNNGKWDPGDLYKNIQPESVYYYNEIIKLRSNWERNINWSVSLQPSLKVRDPEIEAAEQKKIEEEKARKRNENQNTQGKAKNPFSGSHLGF